MNYLYFFNILTYREFMLVHLDGSVTTNIILTSQVSLMLLFVYNQESKIASKYNYLKKYEL